MFCTIFAQVGPIQWPYVIIKLRTSVFEAAQQIFIGCSLLNMLVLDSGAEVALLFSPTMPPAPVPHVCWDYFTTAEFAPIARLLCAPPAIETESADTIRDWLEAALPSLVSNALSLFVLLFIQNSFPSF